MGIIQIKNHNVSLQIKRKKDLKSFLESIFAEEAIKAIEITYILCDDSFLISLNQQYLNHDTYTDILTFTLSEPTHPVISEIYISIERVKENAKKLNISFDTELQRVMIHGILHLCGYNDHKKAEKKAMRSKEDYYIAKF